MELIEKDNSMQNAKQIFRRAKVMATSIAVAVALSAFASSAQAAGKNGSATGRSSLASFCNGWKATCLSRTGGDSDFCALKVSACRLSGCFTEGSKFGGGTHCVNRGS
jgi:invasion protein IalB